MLFHYGLAVSWAPLYAVLRRRGRLHPITAGLATGSAMSLIADEGMTPALGFWFSKSQPGESVTSSGGT